MNAREFKELLDKYGRGECSQEEEKLVIDWYENIGHLPHERIEEDDKEAIQTLLWAKIKPPPQAITPGRKQFYLMSRVAAAVAVLVIAGAGAYIFLKELAPVEQRVEGKNVRILAEGTYTNTASKGGKPDELTLSDGSEVLLMPESEVRVFKSFSGNERREIYLSGEASFKVKHDPARPFIVYTSEVVTKVLGTTFSIKAFENEREITVAVKTGKVSVYSGRQGKPVAGGTIENEVILTPNQQVVYNRDNDRASKELVKQPEIILEEPTLFEMSYDAVPVAKIFDALEENYGVDIVYDGTKLKECVVTTSMSDEGFIERIEVICKAINAKYTISKAVVIIESQGCK